MARPEKPTSRPYGRQAKGKTIKSLSIESELLAKAEKEAKAKGMNFSEYISALISKILPPLLLAFALFHLSRTPSDWSSKALLATGKAAISTIGRALA